MNKVSSFSAFSAMCDALRGKMRNGSSSCRDISTDVACRVSTTMSLLNLVRKKLGILAFGLLCVAAQAQTIDFTDVSNGASGTGWSFNDDVLLVTGNANITVKGQTSNGKRIEVAADATNVNITLEMLTIIGGHPLTLNSNSNVNLILTGANFFTAGYDAEGILVKPTSSLTISGDDNGSIDAIGGGGAAGIGGGGDITINSGKITADGGAFGGAGIGSSWGETSGNITINGGEVTANGSNGGAGIGGSIGGSNTGAIVITGGKVEATGNVGGAGIGGGAAANYPIGQNGGNGGTVTISGGIVTATGDTGRGVGIGGGAGANLTTGGAGANLTITGNAIVTAIGGQTLADTSPSIGGGMYGGTAGTLSMSGNPVIFANAQVSDMNESRKTGGIIIFQNNEYDTGETSWFSASLTLGADVEIPDGYTLIVIEEHTLIVPAGITLTIASGAELANNGITWGCGTIDDIGDMTGNPVLTNCSTTYYSVNFNVVNGNGSLAATVDQTAITTGASIEAGKNIVFTATPASNYRVKEWRLNDAVVTGNTTNTYTLTNLSATATVTVEFEIETNIPTTYSVNFNVVNGNGALAATVDQTAITTGASVEAGKNIVFTATPASNFRVKEWRLNGAVVTGNTSNALALTNISAATTVTVEFEEDLPPGAVIDLFVNSPASSGEGWTFADNVYTIQNGANVIITGISTNQRRIAVATDAKNVKITLADVNIAFASSQSPLLLNNNAEVTLTLVGTNMLTAGSGRAGVRVPHNAELTINGNGSLIATGGSSAAGIGGSTSSSAGTIVINGGIITASGGSGGAGIGGGGGAGSVSGADGAGGAVIINRGITTAIGGNNAQGIGRGSNTNASVGTFTMNSNAVVFTNSVGDNTMSRRISGILFIGNTGTFYGQNVNINNNVTIPADYTIGVPTGSTLTISAGITLKNYGTVVNCGTINRSGSYGTWTDNEPIACNVIDLSLSPFSPAGTGWTYSNDVYTIQNNADVFITGTSANQRRIVVAQNARNVNITFRDVVIAELSANQSPLLLNSGAEVTLVLSGTNRLTAGTSGAGIRTSAATLTITGTGSLTANGGTGGAGIGGSSNGAGGTIIINDGFVTATGGGSNAQGIGRGSGTASSGTLTMNGNAVVFTNSVGDTDVSRKTGGILFVGNTGTFYGWNVTIGANVIISANHTLTIPVNATLSIPANNALTNNGTVVNFGTINHSGNFGAWLGTPYIVPSANIDLSLNNPTSAGTGWTYANNVYTIQNNANVVITGTSANQRRIVVAQNAQNVNITFRDVVIQGLSADLSPLLLNSGAEVTLALSGTNRLTAGANRAGIQTWDGRLTITGTGSLTAIGGTHGAGIGGGSNTASGGTIIINDGVVTATGGSNAQGIGRGIVSASSGTLTMNGNAVVFANSVGDTDESRKTGGILFDGNRGSFYGWDVTINANIVIPANHTLTVPANATLSIAATNTLTNNGTVANFGTINHSGNFGTWLGNPYIVPSADINLSQSNPPSIGIGWTFASNVYVIQDGANVNITGTSTGQRRISVAQNAKNVRILLEDVTIAGLGDNQSPLSIGSDAEVTLTLSGVNSLTAGNNRAGIQATGATLTITGGGSLIATGGSDGAGIGGGVNFSGIGEDGGNIIINNGVITAIGGINAQGIGRGNSRGGPSSGTLTMNGNGVLFTNSVGDTNVSRRTGGILFTGNNCTFYGQNVTISADVAIPVNHTLTVPENATLTIPANITLTNNGTVYNFGTINYGGNNGLWAGIPYIVPSAIIDLNLNNPPPGIGWTFADNVYTIQDGANVNITGTSSGQRRIVVAANAKNVSITLEDVTISSLANNQSPLLLNSGAEVTLTLLGTNRLAAENNCAGIQTTGATLTITGTGNLTATGGSNGAGIGSGSSGAGGTIFINGGVITATGGSNAQGIGRGSGSASSGTLTMNGNAVVFASSVGDTNVSRKTGGILFDGSNGTLFGSNVTISSDVIIPANHTLIVPETATLSIAANNTLTNNGTVLKLGAINHGGNFGTWAGIPYTTPSAIIDISDNNPVSQGIGWTFANNVYTILDGANVSITGTSTGQRRIEVANNAKNVRILVEDVTIAGLGAGQSPLLLNSGAEVALTLSGTNILTAGNDRAGIQTTGATLTLTGGGSLIVTGGSNGAGIGGSNSASGGTIFINGGVITATGGNSAQGIGSGSGSSGTLTMNGNAVVFASSVGDTDVTRKTGGILFNGNNGTFYGQNVIISTDVAIPVNHTLTIPANATLSIAANSTLTNNGTVHNFGAINHDGSYGVWAGNPYVAPSADIYLSLNNPPSSGNSWTFSNNVYTIQDGANVSITGTSTGQRRILVASNAKNVRITLEDVTISGLGDNLTPLSIGNGAEVTLTLAGTNTLTAGNNNAGIRTTGATLTITGGGSLIATGGSNGAGIGGRQGEAGGTIIINGGVVAATGGDSAQGIGRGSGSGNASSNGTLTMNGSALVFTNSVGDTDESRRTNGILVISDNTHWYGNDIFTLGCDATVPADYTLTVETFKTLNIPENITLTNNGTIVDAGGSINIEGSFAGNKILFENKGGVTANQASSSTPIDVSYLFTINNNAGAQVYTIENGSTGEGFFNGANLTVTRGGVFIIGLVTAETEHYVRSEKVTSTLNVGGTTSAPELLSYSTPLRAWTHNGLLHISGLETGEVWSVYTVSGALIYRDVAGSEEAEIALRTQGVYIIQSGDRTLRVVFE